VTLRVPTLDRSAPRAGSGPGFCWAAVGTAKHATARARVTAATRRMA
jgi:hypothetical protein